MIDFILFKLDFNVLIFWTLRVIFLIVGIGYVIYALLQIRQIGIMNNTLKTKASVPIALLGIFHLFFVIAVVAIIEIFLFLQK